MVTIETGMLITIWAFIVINIIIGAGITLALIKIMKKIAGK